VDKEEEEMDKDETGEADAVVKRKPALDIILYQNGISYLLLSMTSKILKERDKKGEQGGSKRTISELTTKQLTTAIISSIQKANADNGAEDTPKKSNASQAGNAFGGKGSAKRSITD